MAQRYRNRQVSKHGRFEGAWKAEHALVNQQLGATDLLQELRTTRTPNRERFESHKGGAWYAMS